MRLLFSSNYVSAISSLHFKFEKKRLSSLFYKKTIIILEWFTTWCGWSLRCFCTTALRGKKRQPPWAVCSRRSPPAQVALGCVLSLVPLSNLATPENVRPRLWTCGRPILLPYTITQPSTWYACSNHKTYQGKISKKCQQGPSVRVCMCVLERVCVRVSVLVRVRACFYARVRVRVRVCARVRVRVHACML